MVVSKSRRKTNGVWAATKRRPRKTVASPAAAVCLEAKLGELKKSAEIRLEGKLSDYLNTVSLFVLGVLPGFPVSSKHTIKLLKFGWV